MTDSPSPPLVFEVAQDEMDGGFSASAVGYGIHTQGDTAEELRRNIREAVECYFDDEMRRPATPLLATDHWPLAIDHCTD